MKPDHPRRPVVDLRSVGKTYSGGTAVLFDVDLQIQSGELVAIVGPSGSGKSTLLNIMGTLDQPSTGTVEIDGRDVLGMGDAAVAALRARTMGFVFQQFHLLAGVSALGNVAEGLLYRGTTRTERRERAATALERVGLGHRIEHRPAQLSGGERQRVAIARALVGEPQVVFADEPTGSLDSRSGREILTLLQTLNAGGTTIVVITHDLAIAAALPRQIAVCDGRVAIEPNVRAAAPTASVIEWSAP